MLEARGEFYVAGGGVHPVANGMATAADWMSAASFISMAGLIANMGYGGSVFLMGWTGGYVLLAMLLAPYLRKFGKFTVPEFIGDRFYSKGAAPVAVICLLVASITYIIGQMTGVGVAFSLLGRDERNGYLHWYGDCVRVCCVWRHEGHYLHPGRAVHRVDFGLHHACRVHFIEPDWQPFATIGSGGSDMPVPMAALLATLDQVVTELGFPQYTTNSRGDMLNTFFYTVSLMIGTAGLPHVIVRFFTVTQRCLMHVHLRAGLWFSLRFCTQPHLRLARWPS